MQEEDNFNDVEPSKGSKDRLKVMAAPQKGEQGVASRNFLRTAVEQTYFSAAENQVTRIQGFVSCLVIN